MTDTTENRLPTTDATEEDTMPVSAQITAANDDDAEATTPRIDGGTISRFVILLLALINQAWTAGSAIWCYWKDNDVTKRARVKKARLSARHAA